MPQARRAGTRTSKAPAGRSAAAKPAAAKPAAAKAAAAKPAARKPAAARAATTKKPAAASRPAATRSASTKAATASKPAAAKAARATKPAGAATKGSPRVSVRVTADAKQLELIAERLRKLNEKIIEFGREAGESTLTSYEKALKTIASGVSQSSAKDELEWITHLAASQAKFVREITDSWAKSARQRLK